MTRNDSAQNHGWNPWDVVDLMVPDVVGHWIMGSWDNLREDIYKRGPWLGSWTAAPKMGSFFVPVNSTVRGSGRRLLNWSKSHWFGHPRAGASPMFQKVLVP